MARFLDLERRRKESRSLCNESDAKTHRTSKALSCEIHREGSVPFRASFWSAHAFSRRFVNANVCPK
jgi:hypothetical protein